MDTYLQTILGIVVSVVLFLIGYRQTIGARKERERAANASLLRALVRRVVLEDYTPDPGDLARLTYGKARDFRVRISDLLTPEQLLTVAFSDVFDNDLIVPAARAAIESRLRAAFTDFGSQAPKTTEVQLQERVIRRDEVRRRLPLLALSTSLIGGLTVMVPEIVQEGSRLDVNVLLAAGVVFA